MTVRSRSSRKGYDGERPVELLLQQIVPNVYRPRAGRHDDVGDIAGLPIVVSVKNHVTLKLAAWVDELGLMLSAADKATGVVWHKRVRKGSPLDWYVTMSGLQFMPFLNAYLREVARDVPGD